MTSGLTYTIFRPSVIYGPGDQSINLFALQIRRLSFFPVIGDGLYQLQPVPVWQMAESFAKALELPVTENKIYEAGGPEPLAFKEVIDTLARVLKRRIIKVRQPVLAMRLAAGALGRLPWFPLTLGQLRMLLEGSTWDASGFYHDFGLTPISFEEGLSRYLA